MQYPDIGLAMGMTVTLLAWQECSTGSTLAFVNKDVKIVGRVNRHSLHLLKGQVLHCLRTQAWTAALQDMTPCELCVLGTDLHMTHAHVLSNSEACSCNMPQTS